MSDNPFHYYNWNGVKLRYCLLWLIWNQGFGHGWMIALEELVCRGLFLYLNTTPGMMHKFLLLARNLKIHQFLELSPWSSCPIGHEGRNWGICHDQILLACGRNMGPPSLFDSVIRFSATRCILSLKNCCRIRTWNFSIYSYHLSLDKLVVSVMEFETPV